MRTEIPVSVPDGELGEWKVSTFTVTEEEAKFQNMRAMISNSARFIEPGTYKRLTKNGEVIMSNTPVEIMDLDPLFYEVKWNEPKTILLAGLGLGVALTGLLDFDFIERIDVVEIEPDVIELVGKHYDDPRVTIICADIFDFKPSTKYDVIWFDIWPSICSDNLDDIKKLFDKFRPYCKWQGAWALNELIKEEF